MYYLFFILLYPVIASSKEGFLAFNIVLLIYTLAKIHKEVMELKRTAWAHYSRDFYNALDWGEIFCLICIVVCHFIDSPYREGRTDYSVALRIADGLLIFVPLFINLRVLILFRAFRGIGSVQISFTKMFDDIFSWLAILMIIMTGFAGSFSLLGEVFYNNQKHYASSELTETCNDSIYGRTKRSFLESMWEVVWIMFNGPDDDDILSIRECYGFDWFLHVCVYILVAALAMMLIVVLVNLLIVMMSKTFDRVSGDNNRDIEWTFHMINLNVKFIRRDLVAPIPMNLLPHFYKHFCSVRRRLKGVSCYCCLNRCWFLLRPRREFSSKSNQDFEENLRSREIKSYVELSQEEIKTRNEDYNKVVAGLCKRYRRKYL